MTIRRCRVVGCRNTRCSWEGSCGQFFSPEADAAAPGDVAKLAGVLCQCGCPGAQHAEWYEDNEVETQVNSFSRDFARFVASRVSDAPRGYASQKGADAGTF